MHLVPELSGANSPSYTGGEAVLRLPRLALGATCLQVGEYALVSHAFEHVRITVYFSNGMSKESIGAPATHATLDDWIAREATPFSVDSPRTFNAAVKKMIASLGDSVELLGFGEALHGGKDILILRNRLFQRLVEAHGYSAIAIESSFPRARVVNEYVAGCGAGGPGGAASYEAVQDTGFSHGFGRLDANRELVEWMRH